MSNNFVIDLSSNMSVNCCQFSGELSPNRVSVNSFVGVSGMGRGMTRFPWWHVGMHLKVFLCINISVIVTHRVCHALFSSDVYS